MGVTATAAYVLMALSALVSGAAAALTWRRRTEPGAVPLAVVFVAISWWSATYLGELLATTLEGKLLWARLEWFGSLLIPVAWVVFVLEYTGRDEYVTPRTVGALAVPWAVSIPLVWTNPAHHLVRIPLGLREVNGLVLLDQQYGPWFLVVAAYTYVLVLVGAGLLVRLAASGRVLYRGQALALMTAGLVPLAVNAGSVFAGIGVDLTPFGFAVTGVACLVAMTRYDLLEATPVAALTGTEAVIESMDEGVLVVDARGQVVDANRSAERLLDRPASSLVGEPLAAVLPAYEADEGRVLVTHSEGRSDVAIEVNATTLRDRRGHPVGRTLVLRDVTGRHEYLQRIEVLNRVLRHNLRTEMNVVVGHVGQLREELPASAEGSLSEIEGAAGEMLDLAERAREVQQLLDRDARPDGTRTVGEITERVLRRARADAPDVDLRLDALPAAPVACDPLLEVILANVVENAVAYGPETDALVVVSVRHDGDRVEIAVADNGDGIPAQERSVLTAGRETPLEHGSGLGLWLVKWGVDHLRGTLSIEDRPSGGSLVRMRVPPVSANPDAVRSRSATERQGPGADDGEAGDSAGTRREPGGGRAEEYVAGTRSSDGAAPRQGDDAAPRSSDDTASRSSDDAVPGDDPVTSDGGRRSTGRDRDDRS